MVMFVNHFTPSDATDSQVWHHRESIKADWSTVPGNMLAMMIVGVLHGGIVAHCCP